MLLLLHKPQKAVGTFRASPWCEQSRLSYNSFFGKFEFQLQFKQIWTRISNFCFTNATKFQAWKHSRKACTDFCSGVERNEQDCWYQGEALKVPTAF